MVSVRSIFPGLKLSHFKSGKWSLYRKNLFFCHYLVLPLLNTLIEFPVSFDDFNLEMTHFPLLKAVRR